MDKESESWESFDPYDTKHDELLQESEQKEEEKARLRSRLFDVATIGMVVYIVFFLLFFK